MAEKRLSDEGVISYKDDIEPYPFIAIYAGVGSGKTTYFLKLAKGEIKDAPKKTVLLITSRRAKVNETRADKTLQQDSYIGQHDDDIPFCETDEELESILNSEHSIEDPNGWGEQSFRQRSMTCTNAAIESYLANHYSEPNKVSHLWNRFDFIVLDEAHSVRADASYQSAPYYVQKLVNRVYQLNRAGETTCKVVVMTGTPEIISTYGFPSKGNIIERREECINVVPPKVCFITAEQAQGKMLSILKNGQRGVYFYNHVRTLMSAYNSYKKEHPEFLPHITIDFTKKSTLDDLKKNDEPLYKKIVATEKAIETTSMLPEDTWLFLTSERNKEGINIEDEDVKVMFVESHVGVTVMQMAGRVRNGLDVLYVIVDSSGHDNKESAYEWQLTSREDFRETINDEFSNVCALAEYDPQESYRSAGEVKGVKDYIKYIHDKFPYIRYDYLGHKFVLYEQRRQSIDYYTEQNKAFDRVKDITEQLCRLVKTWFPDAEVTDERPAEKVVTAYLEEHGLLGVKISCEQKVELIKFLLELRCEPYRANAQLNTLLKKYGYEIKLEHSANAGGTISKL